MSEKEIKTINGLPLCDQKAREEIRQLWKDIENLPSGGGTVVSSIEPMEDDIPKVFFDKPIPQTKSEYVTKFRYYSKTKVIDGYAKIKAQGNSSLTHPKKNITVKMYEDEACETKLKVDFKGWGEQSKHVYKANWIDLTHARNIVSARLWGDIVKTRSEYESYPTEFRTSPNQGAIDGFPIKVYSQGVYQGRYSLNIPKDAWMTNMNDSLDNHCILCSENYESGCFRASANINGSDWSDEVHDTVPTSIKTRWNEVISFVMDSSESDFKANLSNYFYVDSLIDYFIFGVVSCGLDGFGKNQLYDTYDGGQKWIASMYDMDSTWGLWWNGGSFVSPTYSREEFQDFKDGQGNLLFIRLLNNFSHKIKPRANELLNGILSVPNIINEFERFTDIAPLDLVKEDYASTTGSGKFTGIPLQDTNNIQQIRQYVIDRHAYCVEYFNNIDFVEIPATNITLDKTSLSITKNDIYTLVATVEPSNTTDEITWESSDTNVATVNNGIVTPIENGDCTITVKVGELSATCSVNVNIVSQEDSSIIYRLDTPKTLNQSSYDTGISLMNEDNSHTLAFTINFTGNELKVINVANEYYLRAQSYIIFNFVFGCSAKDICSMGDIAQTNTPERIKFVLTHEKDSNEATCYILMNGEVYSQTVTASNNSYINAENVKFPSLRGTVEDLVIYSRVLASDEIETYLS